MKTLISQEQLREGIDRFAKELRERYEGRPLTIVGLLIGSIVFLADLILVVGYGLDYHDMYRNLPYVAELEPSDLGEPGR